MIKFGKLQQVDHEEINILVGQLEITEFKDGKKQPTKIQPELEIDINFSINNTEYNYDFYIETPFEEYLKLNNYEKIKISEEYIKEDVCLINDEVIPLPKIEIEVQKINDNLIFIISAKSFFDEYFFTLEQELSLANIEQAI